MRQQLRYLLVDIGRITNGRWWRWLGLVFMQSFAAVAFYRLDRGMSLRFGRKWSAGRILLSPLIALVRPWHGCEIHYQADIGPGLLILHPSLGVVVSAFTVAGEALELTGGNCIGSRASGGRYPGVITLGDQVSLGVNASVIGPAQIGDRVQIGAHALVVDDVPSDGTVLGARGTVV